MVFALAIMLAPRSAVVQYGKVTLSSEDLNQNDLVSLDGDWEFYWDQLLTPEVFIGENSPQADSLMIVPGAWDRNAAYLGHGVATYRLIMNYPVMLKDPALSIKTVATAYKLYVNGQFAAEVGTVSKQPSKFKEGAQVLIIDLPTDKQEVELVFQVANLNYAKGGLRESLVFGSKQVLEQNRMILMALQLLFIGSVIIFGVYYLLLFIMQTKNKTALIFSILCFITGLRSLIWGELPLMIFFPKISYDALAYINYFTGFNLIPMMVLFVISIYPSEYKKVSLGLVLLPTLFFETLLLTSVEFMSIFTNYLYLLILLQMIYMISVMIKAVIRKRDNAVLMYIATCVYCLAINQDILHYKGIGGINISYMFLYGNIAVIIAMSYVQAKQQANTHKKLILYNENLLEADRLKDKIMATEISFLQAQIKPHFLYNALDAIANVCEEDGEKASELIVDLSIYLRGCLEFNSLDRMVRLEKELEFVDTYFKIEQARFGQKIQLIEEIEISLDYQIPMFILQPLVENAVRHGISKKQLGGRVTVRGIQMPYGISIEIEDDGVGIEGEKLARLLSDKSKEQGVGLLNIHHRLLRLYGRGLEIRSEVGHGTCVRLVIPKEA
ncbi:MAG: histidine kinase [Sporomusaceae bacterium]|nr:histidine kinase [Sporomusaceae bacterium]